MLFTVAVDPVKYILGWKNFFIWSRQNKRVNSTRVSIITDTVGLFKRKSFTIVSRERKKDNLSRKLNLLSRNESNVFRLSYEYGPTRWIGGTRDTVHVDQFITRTRCIIQTIRVYV